MDNGSLLWSCVVGYFCFNNLEGHIFLIVISCIFTTEIYAFISNRQGLQNRKENGRNELRWTYKLGLTVCLLSGFSQEYFLAICTFLELLSMWNLTRIEVKLCNILSPEAPRLSIVNYNWFLVSISPNS